MQTNQVQAIQSAVRILGNQAALARALGVTPATVGQWLKPDVRTGREVPPKQCVRIEQLTQGAVTRRDLRPDDYLEFWPELAPGVVSIAPASTQPTAIEAPQAAKPDALRAGIVRRHTTRRAKDLPIDAGRRHIGAPYQSAETGVA